MGPVLDAWPSIPATRRKPRTRGSATLSSISNASSGHAPVKPRDARSYQTPADVRQDPNRGCFPENQPRFPENHPPEAKNQGTTPEIRSPFPENQGTTAENQSPEPENQRRFPEIQGRFPENQAICIETEAILADSLECGLEPRCWEADGEFLTSHSPAGLPDGHQTARPTTRFAYRTIDMIRMVRKEVPTKKSSTYQK